MDECRSCGARITWAKTIKGRPIPLDPEPSPKGNVVISEEGVALVYTSPGGIAPRYEGHPRFLSHFATCPNADEHRRR